MKVIVKRVERINRSGRSKAGNDYIIDQTNIVCDVPFSSQDGFGSKEISYQYGNHTKFIELEPLRDKLPCEIDIELGQEFNQYDQPVTVVKSVKLPSVAKS